MKLINRIIAPVGGALAIGAVLAAVNTGVAHADDETLLAQLHAHGFYDGNGGSGLVHNAHRVCALLDQEDGRQVAHDMYLHTDLASESSAAEFVVIAANNLCPWQWHPAGPSSTV